MGAKGTIGPGLDPVTGLPGREREGTDPGPTRNRPRTWAEKSVFDQGGIRAVSRPNLPASFSTGADHFRMPSLEITSR